MHCCVCGQVYQDLARFIYHCQSHDESEYLKVCTSKRRVKCQPHAVVGPPPLMAIPTNEFLESTNNGDNPVNDEANIIILNNPIYSSNSTFPFACYNTVSLLSLHSSNCCLPSYGNQVVHHNQMPVQHSHYNMCQL